MNNSLGGNILTYEDRKYYIQAGADSGSKKLLGNTILPLIPNANSSNTIMNGTVKMNISASSYLSSSYAPAKTFSGGSWCANASPGWLKVEFSVKTYVNLFTCGNPNNTLSEITLQYSDDNNKWINAGTSKINNNVVSIISTENHAHKYWRIYELQSYTTLLSQFFGSFQ